MSQRVDRVFRLGINSLGFTALLFSSSADAQAQASSEPSDKPALLGLVFQIEYQDAFFTFRSLDRLVHAPGQRPEWKFENGLRIEGQESSGAAFIPIQKLDEDAKLITPPISVRVTPDVEFVLNRTYTAQETQQLLAKVIELLPAQPSSNREMMEQIKSGEFEIEAVWSDRIGFFPAGEDDPTQRIAEHNLALEDTSPDFPPTDASTRWSITDLPPDLPDDPHSRGSSHSCAASIVQLK